MSVGGLRIDEVRGHQIWLGSEGLGGRIRFWAPECINVAYPGFEPEGVRMLYCPEDRRGADRVDILPTLMRQSDNRLPPVYTRGPETMLKTETGDGQTSCELIADSGVRLSVHKPGVLRYDSELSVAGGVAVVEATVANESSWDWRGANVFFCCGLDPSEPFVDHTGERTVVFCGCGARRVNDLTKVMRPAFRAGAQYFEAQGHPMPRTGEGFAYDECGISADKVVAGLVVRESKERRHVLAVACRLFHNVFVDLGIQNNCVHVNPSAGDLPSGESATIRAAVCIRCGSLTDVASLVCREAGIILPPGWKP